MPGPRDQDLSQRQTVSGLSQAGTPELTILREIFVEMETKA